MSNLSKNKKDNKDSIQKRIERGEIIVIPTDKSGKLAVMPLSFYEELGEVHTRKDKEITEKEVTTIQKDLKTTTPGCC